MNAYAPPSGGAGSGRPSGVRAASRPAVGRSGGVVSAGGGPGGAADGAASGTTGVHGHELGPRSTATPRLRRTRSGTTTSARSTVRARPRTGPAPSERQGTDG